ncbi:MAG: hypothetical protein GF330_10430 [Candidatus Eisenbacteria bacterium]|nr:hypothetical protein [Candidatus Eisenbacteria bacterium]
MSAKMARAIILGLILPILPGGGLLAWADPPAPPRAGADPAENDELDLLLRWMTGAFSSAAQAAADSSYYDIRLQMVPIWPTRADGRWLYVEQAVAGHEDRPYRQRIYRVDRIAAGTYRSRVYELTDPLRFAGAWRDVRTFDALSPDSLTLREGCAVLLQRRADGAFAGTTREGICRSSLRGASYATSEVVVTAHGIVSWDRGFDDQGQQVWGATAGGYRFARRSRRNASETSGVARP